MRNSLPELQAVLPSPVLVVEDEPLLQQRLQGILLQLGYAPDALLFAASFSEARACLASQPVSLALVDLMLPDGSGRDLIAHMRAESPEMGILVVSAWSSEESILSALRAGATGYILKERDDIEVSMSIRSVLRGGAPIDPFIARRILQLLPLGDDAGERSVTRHELSPPAPKYSAGFIASEAHAANAAPPSAVGRRRPPIRFPLPNTENHSVTAKPRFFDWWLTG